MNKLKMFFVGAALLLVTAGVFAGKAKYFTAAPNLFLYDATLGYQSIASTGIGADFAYGVTGNTLFVSDPTTGASDQMFTYISGTGGGYKAVVTTSF